MKESLIQVRCQARAPVPSREGRGSRSRGAREDPGEPQSPKEVGGSDRAKHDPDRQASHKGEDDRGMTVDRASQRKGDFLKETQGCHYPIKHHRLERKLQHSKLVGHTVYIYIWAIIRSCQDCGTHFFASGKSFMPDCSNETVAA